MLLFYLSLSISLKTTLVNLLIRTKKPVFTALLGEDADKNKTNSRSEKETLRIDAVKDTDKNRAFAGRLLWM